MSEREDDHYSWRQVYRQQGVDPDQHEEGGHE
jgi:hypothetical protein